MVGIDIVNKMTRGVRCSDGILMARRLKSFIYFLTSFFFDVPFLPRFFYSFLISFYTPVFSPL